MLSLNRWILILFTGAVLLGASGTALAGGSVWPTPPNGWWKSLKGGESATYNMVVGSDTMKIVITVDKIEGSVITVTTHDQTRENTQHGEKEVIDAAIADVGALPIGASVKKGESTIVKVGNKFLGCTVYQVEINGMKMKNCRSPQLPPIFNSGVVKMEAESGDEYRATMVLKDYNGALIGGSEKVTNN